MNPTVSFFLSSIGKKWIVALTGLVLIAYVLGHLAGNLQIFLPPEYINRYAQFLHSLGALLWVIRAFLIGCLVLHILTTIKLAQENRAARPESYAVKKCEATTLAARTMVWSGLIVLSFIIFHLLHFTARKTDMRFRPIEEGGLLRGEYDVHTMVILAFQHPLVSGFYVLSLFLLCQHLSHGFSSVVQTLGLNSRKTFTIFHLLGTALAWLIFAGYVSIPVAVLTGFLHL